jgi:hypothetical protein
MKKTLLSIALIGSAFAATSQSLFSETFNSYATKSNMTTALSTTDAGKDAAGQGGWYAYVYDTQVSDTSFNMVSVGTNDNALKITGTDQAYSNATNGSRTRSIYNGFNWAKRTAGNNILYSSFVFSTGKANASRNSIAFVVRNSAFNTLLRLKYDKATHKISATIGGMNTTVTPAVAATANYSITGTLIDEHYYYCEMFFNKNTKTPYFFVYDAEGSGAGTLKLNLKGAALTDADLALYATPQIFEIFVSAQSDATDNALSSEFIVDDINIKARACLDWDAVASAKFSYATTSNCLGGANLTPVLVNTASKGAFKTTTGLDLNATTGVINLGSTTTAGSYDVKFVTVDPYKAASGSTAAVPGACPDSAVVNVKVLNCAGIDENNVSSYSIFPNPANDFISVTFSDLAENNGTIRLLSADGKVIETRNYSNASVETFDVKSLNSGVYFFQIGNITEKVIIK